MDDVKQADDLNEDTRIQILANYKATLNNLRATGEYEACTQVLMSESESVAARIDQLKQQRSELKDKKPAVEETLSLQELEQLLPQSELQLSTLKKARAAAESESQLRSQRRKEIRARVVAINEKIADTVAQLQALSAVVPTTQSTSYSARLSSRKLVLQKESSCLEAELAKYDAEESSDLTRLKIDLATNSATHTEKCIVTLQARINAGREAAAEQSVRMARMEAIDAAPSLKEYAEHNQLLAEKAKSVAAELVIAQRQFKEANEVHEALIRQFNLAKKKVVSVGLTSSVGAMLRKQKSNLPDVSERRAAVANRQALINDTQYDLFEYEDQRQEVGEPEELVAQILQESENNGPVNNEMLESAATELLKRKGEYLDGLIRSSNQYFETLIELDSTDQQVIRLAAEYQQYIDERVLWIRSGRALTTDFSIEPSDTWLISPTMWSQVGGAISTDIRRVPWLYGFSLVIAGGSIIRGRSSRTQISTLGEAAAKANCRSIIPTLKTVLLTVGVSITWPLIFAFVGWRLRGFGDQTNFGQSSFVSSVGRAMLLVSLIWFSMEVMRQVCRPRGLGESHFRWPAYISRTLRRYLQRMLVIATPLIFVTSTLSTGTTSPGRDSVERTMFIIGMMFTAFAVARLSMPQGPLREYYAASQNHWVERLKYVWSAAAAFVPLSLGGLAVTGYYYTAQVLFWRMFATCIFVTVLFVFRELCFRMLMLRKRHLSMEQSRNRASASLPTGEPKPVMVAGIVTDDPQADIIAQTLQTRRLVSTGMMTAAILGMWLIWVQVLPALSMLDHYPLWSRAAQASDAVASASPTAAMTPVANSDEATKEATTIYLSPKPVEEFVTISDLALAIIIVVVTFILSRNGPALLEMSVLQQLPMEASVRYAIKTLVSYAIVLVGTIAACSTIGLQWSQIQWLATALTFGLAFGLQEMFANFVAGLIILLERPIRVGDVVTVDDVTGVVSRIRIRATSITNWDRKEYVVPNKEFITGRLLNWTLTDKVNRVVIHVGVGYGTDTDRAREILLTVANEHPLVLKDPPAAASFEGFGDSSLNFVLRTYLASMESRLDVIHELHTSIHKAFRAEGIEIPFPQRDLNLRSAAGLLAAAPQERDLEQLDLQRRKGAA